VNPKGETIWEINKNDLPASSCIPSRKCHAWPTGTP
jgi:hypothetical protein